MHYKLLCAVRHHSNIFFRNPSDKIMKFDCFQVVQWHATHPLSVAPRLPEFLCDHHYSFCDVIPPNCIQMRNLILSAFPTNMRLPDPFKVSRTNADWLHKTQEFLQKNSRFQHIFTILMHKLSFKSTLSNTQSKDTTTKVYVIGARLFYQRCP